jgi:hypothetical protein
MLLAFTTNMKCSEDFGRVSCWAGVAVLNLIRQLRGRQSWKRLSSADVEGGEKILTVK